MVAQWVADEMQNVNLNDQRLNRRLVTILEQLGTRPAASIPEACGGRSETEAAYRLFNNDKVTFDNVLQPHREKTWQRIAAQKVAVLVQDTTEIDLTRPSQQVQGAGPLDGGSRRGAFLHLQHAFTPDGTPLGTAQARIWTRDDEPLPNQSSRSTPRKKTPIEDKESCRWVETLQQAAEMAEQLPETQLVCTADSEADIYELLVAANETPSGLDWIVRACQNRAVLGEFNNGAARRLQEQLQECEVLFEQTLKVGRRRAKVSCESRARRENRESRTARVDVRARSVTLRPPSRPDRRLEPVTVNAILVREVDPPEGETPVEWVLLTSLPIESVEQVRQVLEYYCVRWLIEVFFRTLKSVCRVEERRFEELDRLLPCLAVYLIIAWRALFVCRLAREFPDVDCELVFERDEWQSAYTVVHRRPLPPQPPSLQEMVRLVAELGGYASRKRSDHPGPQTVSQGLQRLHDITLCWQAFGPPSRE